MARYRREEGGPATESAVGDWQPAPGTEAADPGAARADCRGQCAVAFSSALGSLRPLWAPLSDQSCARALGPFRKL